MAAPARFAPRSIAPRAARSAGCVSTRS
jgi:hypothetical protein